MTTAAEPDIIRVVIVDDHDVVAAGLASLIEDEDDIVVCATARSSEEAAVVAWRERPDVVLMDYRLPDGNGVEATRKIRAFDDAPGVVMITSVADRRVLGAALDAGCCGFVSKHATRDDLVAAVRSAARNESFFTRDVLAHLVQLNRFDLDRQAELSAREIEVLQATADGKSPEQIAAELFLSAHTVKNHLRHAMAKLDAHTKLDAVVKALRARLISIDD